MEWIIGIYVAIGVFKAIGTLSADPTDRPIWMSTQRNPFLWALLFMLYSLVWPIVKR